MSRRGPTPARRLKRRIDTRFYRAFHAMARLFAQPRRSRPAPSAIRRVLIVRHDRIGDWVVTSPVVAMLRELLPHAEIDVLASPANASLVRADERIARTIVNDHSWRGWLGALRELRARRYDLLLSPIYGKGLREGMVAALAARRDTFTVSVHRPRRYQGFFSRSVRVPPSWRHMSERLLFVAQRAVEGHALSRSASAARWRMHLGTDGPAERRAEHFLANHGLTDFVAVNINAAEPAREWAPAACAATLRLLLAAHDDVQFLLTPPPGKEDRAAEVVRLCDDPRVIAAPPSARLLDLLALLRRARAVITPDTANVHLASAVGCPVLGLFTPGPTPVLWAPSGVPYRLVIAEGRTVSDVAPEAVERAFGELMADLRVGAQGA